MRVAGLMSAPHARRAAPVRAVQRGRRDAAVDGARPPGGRPSPRAVAGGRSMPPPRPPPTARRRWSSRSPLALFAEHRAAGRPIVLATTTPYDLVKPFADRLGLDDVVATRYGVDDDGTLRRHARRAVRVVGGQAAGCPRLGRRSTASTCAELRLLRQRLRHAAALGGRPSGRRSTPTRGWSVMAAARRWPTLQPRRALRA